VIKRVFEKLPLFRVQINQLKKIAGNLFARFPEEFVRKEDISGIVIAGFGENDVFPSLVSFDIEGIAYNRLKFKEHISAKVDFETSAWIVPFAQREMVVTFMEGIDPSYKNVEESYLSKIFDEYTRIIVDSLKKLNHKEKDQLKRKLVPIGAEILKDYWKELGEYSHGKHVVPITTVVSMLPKDELAAMAESLVNLTSFKRKITMERETVGGPIDVALISKGDGFIWIKRKHYFKPELNPQFFANYYKEIDNE
jgi:hypothetical protein